MRNDLDIPREFKKRLSQCRFSKDEIEKIKKKEIIAVAIPYEKEILAYLLIKSGGLSMKQSLDIALNFSHDELIMKEIFEGFNINIEDLIEDYSLLCSYNVYYDSSTGVNDDPKDSPVYNYFYHRIGDTTERIELVDRNLIILYSFLAY